MKANNKPQKGLEKRKQVKQSAKNESKLQKLVKNNPHFKFLENGKIKCLISNHEFLPTLQDYETYLKSKSYKKALQNQFDFSLYEEYLVSHRDNKNFVYCRLTQAKLPKKKTALEKHIQSRKFQHRLQLFKKNGGQQAEEEEQEEQEVQVEVEEEKEIEVVQKPKRKNGKKK